MPDLELNQPRFRCSSLPSHNKQILEYRHRTLRRYAPQYRDRRIRQLGRHPDLYRICCKNYSCTYDWLIYVFIWLQANGWREAGLQEAFTTQKQADCLLPRSLTQALVFCISLFKKKYTNSVVDLHWFQTDPDPGFCWPKLLIFYSWKAKFFSSSNSPILFFKNCHFLSPYDGLPVEAFSPQKRASNTSKHEISSLFSIFVNNFCPLGSGSGSRRLKSLQIYADPDPNTRHWNPNWSYILLIIFDFLLFASRPSVGSHMVQFLNSVYAQLCESPALHRFKQQNDSSENLLSFFIKQFFARQKIPTR